MTTNARIKANRNNAKKSTGPRTEGGKTRASKNALKHGLLARDTVLPGEDPAEFDRQLSALEADIQPANSLEFELVRQIADSQWRMRRLTRLETGFLAAALDETRRYMEKRRPDELRPGYDGETQLLGSAMLDRTQALVHLARYDGHLSRRFFRAVKQLSDLRRDESKAREARSSADSVGPDPYPGPYVPAQAPPPIDGGARAPGGLSKMHGKSRAREGAGPQARACGSVLQRASSHRRGGCTKRGRKSFVAHARSVPRRDSSRRLGPRQPQTTKRTQFRRTPVKSTVARAFLRAVSPFVATCSRSGARSQRAASRFLSTPGAAPTTNNQTNPIPPNPCEINCGARILACRVAIRGDIGSRSGARSQRAASRFLSTSSIENNQTNPISPNPCEIKRRLPIDQRQRWNEETPHSISVG